jgi:hypothetical protein
MLVYRICLVENQTRSCFNLAFFHMLNYSKRTVLEHYSQLFSENYSKSNMFELVTL